MAEAQDDQTRTAAARGEQGPPPPRGPDAAAPPPARRLTKVRIAAGVGVVAVVALAWWLHARHYEDTDDAQIDGNIGAVSARVSGSVAAVHVVDNQAVKAGEVLVELDTADLGVSLAQARAGLEQAKAGVSTDSPSVQITQTSNQAALRSAQSDVENARAEAAASQRELEQAEANDKLAQLQLGRARQLLAGSSISQADFDQRAAAADVSRATVQAARARLGARKTRFATALTRQRETEQNAPRQLVSREANLDLRRANLELAEAQLHQAELNVGYAKVRAAADGVIGRKSVNVGDRVQPGQQLMALTQTGELWVTANFRETQIEHMRAGQPVEVHVDAVSRDYRGVVESFAGATGSRYSLMPPENASGNYVKVVQRVPVRIRLEAGQPDMERLRPGMSAEPSVKVR